MKIGLALSGGGIRAAAHIGAIRAFEENNIKIDVIGGTSAGSIVAAMYAMGYTSDEMYKLFKNYANDVLEVGPQYLIKNVEGRKGFRTDGITSGKNISLVMEEAAKYKNVKNINDLKMKVAIPSVDLITNKEYVFTNREDANEEYYIKDISIGDAVRASSSFPVMYSPFQYKDFQFVDGGVKNNLPAKEVKKLGADKIIAIKFAVEPKKYNSVHNIALRAIDIMNEFIIKEDIEVCDYVLNLSLKGAQVFNINKLEVCYQEGYMQTLDKIKELRKVIENED